MLAIITAVKWTFAFVAASVLVNVGCQGTPPPEPRDADPGAIHFVTMTYNINQSNVSDDTVEAIGMPNADIVCLQEVNAAFEAKIRARYADAYPNMIIHTNESHGGLAVLSRYPLEDKGVIALAGDQAQWHPGLVVKATTPGGVVQVVNVHLRAIFEGDGNPISNYVGSGDSHLSEMNVFLGHAESAVPIIIAGDFNEEPNGASVRDLEDQGYVNVLPLYRPGQYTWSTKSVGGTTDKTEDYIFFDKAFDPLNSWTRRIGSSDHLPVLAHVQFHVSKPQN